MAANYPLLFFNGGGKGQAHAQGDLKIFLDTKLSFPGHPKTVFKNNKTIRLLCKLRLGLFPPFLLTI